MTFTREVKMNSILRKSILVAFSPIIVACYSNNSGSNGGGVGTTTTNNIALSAKSAGQAKAGYLPLKIVNHTNLGGVPVYLFIKATSGNDQCIMKFDPNGVGTCEITNANTILYNYEKISLNDLPKDSAGNTLVYLPKVISGRIYFSIGQPLDLYYDPNSRLVIDPDGFNPRDANYYTLYDKVEFSYNDIGVWANPTAVDFFSMPISMEQPSSVTVQKAGLTVSRNTIYNDVANVFATEDRTPTHEWSKLVLKYINSSSGATTDLRLTAPGKAMVTNLAGTVPFDKDYLADYIDTMLNFYKNGNTLKIDCSELGTANDIYTGTVNASNQFVFKNAANNTVVVDMPNDSTPFFGGAGDTFDAANNTPKAIIIRQLTSAFEVGLLPAPSGMIINRSFFDNSRSKFFTFNSLLNLPGGPWYDLYSKALHSYGHDQPVYTFAYDDALGQDGTLHEPNAASPGVLTVTLHDMSGTTIPNPYVDTKKYNITVHIPATSTVTYNNAVLHNDQVLSNVSMPLHLNLNGQDAKIYLDPLIVKPNSPMLSGVVFNHTSTSDYSIDFPAPSAGGIHIVPLADDVVIPVPTPVPSPVPTPSPTPTVSPVPTPVPSPTPVPTPAPVPVSGEYAVTPRIGNGSIVTTVSGQPLGSYTTFYANSPLTVLVNGTTTVIDLLTKNVVGVNGVVVSQIFQPGNTLFIDFPAPGTGLTPSVPAPTPAVVPPPPTPTPSPAPTPAIGSYSVFPRIGANSVVKKANGEVIADRVSFPVSSAVFTVYVNGVPTTIDLIHKSISGVNGIVVSNITGSGNNVEIDFPAPGTGLTPNQPTPAPTVAPLPTPTPSPSPTPSGNVYNVIPRIGAGSVVTTGNHIPLTHLTAYGTASPMTVLINGIPAVINLTTRQVFGVTGVVVSGVSGANNQVYIDFPAPGGAVAIPNQLP